MSELTPQDLIRRYKAAYSEVNGRGVIATYRNGWFTVGTDFAQAKYRRSDFTQMLRTLEGRAALAASGEK